MNECRASVRFAALVAVAALTGCASEPKTGGAKQAEASAMPPPPPQAGYPAAPSTMTPQAPAHAGMPAPSGGYAQPPARAIALASASNELDTSQRELDVAGGDCRNACRALWSMDRATGRLCELAQSSDEVDRCSDAKRRLLSARDKVKNTCGQCADCSVDRNAPIPSRGP